MVPSVLHTIQSRMYIRNEYHLFAVLHSIELVGLCPFRCESTKFSLKPTNIISRTVCDTVAHSLPSWTVFFKTNRCYSRFKLLIFCCCVFGHFFCLIRYSYCCFIVVSIKIIGINLHHRQAHTLCHLSIFLYLSFLLVLVVYKSNVILTLKCDKNQFKGKLYSLMTSYYQLHATDKVRCIISSNRTIRIYQCSLNPFYW